jgi:hypothetical protein
MRRRQITFVALAFAALLPIIGSACANNGTASGNQTAAPDTAAPDTAAPDSPAPDTSDVENPNAPAALQFSAPLVGGGAIDFSQFAGQAVALWFWAPT